MTSDERITVAMGTVVCVVLGVGLGVIAAETRTSEQQQEEPPAQRSTATPDAGVPEPPRATAAPTSSPEPPRATFQPKQPAPPSGTPTAAARPASFIDGTVRHPDGTPARGIRIAASEQVGFVEGLFFQTGHREPAVSGPDGGFRVRLDAAVEAVTGLDFFVTALAEESSTTIRTVVRGSPQGVPAVYLWEPHLTIGEDRVAWRPAPPSGDGSGIDYRMTLTIPTDVGVAPSMEATAGPDGGVIERRWLEDKPGVLTVSAYAPANPAGQVADDDVHYRTQADLTGPGPALSRDRSCQVIDRGNDVESTLQPCWLTDGDFQGKGRPPSAADCPEAGCRYDQAVVDLGAVAPVDLVLVRDCAFDCTVDTSRDGVNWEPLGGGHGQQVVEGDGRSARWVRLSASLFFVTELSVFTS